MRWRITLVLACALVLPSRSFSRLGLEPPRGYLGCGVPSDEILKAEYQKSLDDARELSKLANDLKAEFEKNSAGGYVLSLATLKKTEEINKLSKRIHGRLKRCQW